MANYPTLPILLPNPPPLFPGTPVFLIMSALYFHNPPSEAAGLDTGAHPDRIVRTSCSFLFPFCQRPSIGSHLICGDGRRAVFQPPPKGLNT